MVNYRLISLALTTPVGMQLVCLKCNPLHKVTGYIDLRHIF
ncbi:hypothetical protein ABN278_23535 [Escherichia coli]|nr:hypothetical protein [Escherichia coli]